METIEAFKFKQNYRRKIKEKRSHLDSFAYQLENQLIFKNMLEILEAIEFETLGIYWPLKGEPDLIKLSIVLNKVALPKIIDNKIKFIKYKPCDKLEKTKLTDLYHPASSIEVIPDVVVIPGLAFSLNGYRIGFGYGYYDRYFAKYCDTIKIGTCFHDSLLEYIPNEVHDHKLNFIITDKMIINL